MQTPRRVYLFLHFSHTTSKTTQNTTYMSKQGPIPKAALPFCENLGLHHNRSMIRYSNRYMHTHGIGLSSHTLIVPKIREEALLFVPMYCPTPKLRHPTAMIMSPTATDPKVCSSTQIIIATTRPIKLIAVPAFLYLLSRFYQNWRLHYHQEIRIYCQPAVANA